MDYFRQPLSSEALSLSPDNKVELVRRVVEFAEDRVPVVGGVPGLPAPLNTPSKTHLPAPSRLSPLPVFPNKLTPARAC
ncbi:MAG: hypothetical protein ACK5NG_11685 [Chthoniobacterales bacterium]